MKILIFSHEIPPIAGGAGTYAYELSKSLAELGNDVYILTGESNDSKGDSINDKSLLTYGISVSRYHWIDKSKSWFIYWDRVFLKYYNKTGPFDLVIFGNYTANIIGSKVFNKLGCPYRIVIHGDDIDYFFSTPRFKDHIMFRKKKMISYFTNAERVVSVSDYLNGILLRYMPSLTNTKVVHHGIDTNIFNIKSVNDPARAKSDILKKHGCSGNEFTVFCSARLVEGKGQDILIDSFSQILCSNENAVLILAGDGPDLDRLKNKVDKYQISKSVIFAGKMKREDLLRYYAACDVFVMNSRRRGETFGIVFIEAMALGKPVIGSNIGGIPEVINDEYNGFLVNPSDASEIVSKINILIEDPCLRANMGERGRNKVENQFNSKLMALETIR